MMDDLEKCQKHKFSAAGTASCLMRRLQLCELECRGNPAECSNKCWERFEEALDLLKGPRPAQD
jgi:hypothetical protein